MIAAATETPEEKRILRVAAYCRVSTDDIDQALSIHLQIQQYMKKIKENPNWKYAGCYVDDGFSGTNTDHRQGFQKLMKDCMDGKIEVIIMNRLGGYLTNATIVNSDFKYYRSTDWGSISIAFNRKFYSKIFSEMGIQLSTKCLIFDLAFISDERGNEQFSVIRQRDFLL